MGDMCRGKQKGKQNKNKTNTQSRQKKKKPSKDSHLSLLKIQDLLQCIMIFFLWDIGYKLPDKWASQVAQWYRTHLPMQETQEMKACSLGWENPLEEGMNPY